MDSYQTIVLSGGGSKGPYGLGVILALDKYHKKRGKNIASIYCGTSAGALNATLAAQGELQELNELYMSLRTRDVLGTDSSRLSKLKMLRVMGRRPFHYFKNDALRAVISKYAHFDSLRDSHLLVCATNYISGELETFYCSPLIHDFVRHDENLPDDQRRMQNYHQIESQEHLVEVLLASSAIPFYFPPVEIGGSLYVDGGVGNNTPLRQAAYVCRFLRHKGVTKFEPTICVINDPGRFKIDHTAKDLDMFSVIRRTLDIFHNELVSDSCMTWDRINKEVRAAEDRSNLLSSQVHGLEGVSLEKRQQLMERIDDVLKSTNTATRRVDMPLIEIRPSAPLVEDVLCFDPQNSARLKKQGIEDCVNTLYHRSLINRNDQKRLLREVD